MDWGREILSWVGLLISICGTAVVFWGVLEAFLGFLRGKRSGWSPCDASPGLPERGEGGRREEIRQIGQIRRQLGSHLLLGLEIFIAEDIINSVVRPSWEKVGMLAAIVAVRTVLSHFLHRELAEEEEAMEKFPAGE